MELYISTSTQNLMSWTIFHRPIQIVIWQNHHRVDFICRSWYMDESHVVFRNKHECTHAPNTMFYTTPTPSAICIRVLSRMLLTVHPQSHTHTHAHIRQTVLHLDKATKQRLSLPSAKFIIVPDGIWVTLTNIKILRNQIKSNFQPTFC